MADEENQAQQPEATQPEAAETKLEAAAEAPAEESQAKTEAPAEAKPEEKRMFQGGGQAGKGGRSLKRRGSLGKGTPDQR